MKNHPAIELKVKERMLAGEVDVPAIRFDLFIDLSAPRAEIMAKLDQALRKFIPYRAIDPRIYEAIALIEREGLGWVDASIRVFGTGEHAGKIRNWHNNLMGDVL